MDQLAEGASGSDRQPAVMIRIREERMSVCRTAASPAWVIGVDFVAPGTPNSNAIVRINPAFYRAV